MLREASYTVVSGPAVSSFPLSMTYLTGKLNTDPPRNQRPIGIRSGIRRTISIRCACAVDLSQPGFTSGRRGRRRAGGARGAGGRLLEESLVAAHQVQVLARALLDRLAPFLQA